MVETVTSTLSLLHTTGDVALPFSMRNIPYFECNFHIYDNDAYYGDGAVQSAIAQAGSVLFFPKGDLRDIFFKSRTSGKPARVVCIATVPDQTVREALKGY